MSLAMNLIDMPVEKRRLRLWIRMLRTTRMVESRLREFLRDDYNTTLPRFDVMAALFRAKSGLKMSDLSKQLLVSNGNVTGIVDRLVADGLVVREAVATDRRAMKVSLSPVGKDLFARMAADHEARINALFAEIDDIDLEAMSDILGRMKKKEAGDGANG